ncbi:M14 family zinc carboxypeptidase [Blastococcus saxobsidens]|uniref:Carboxypeptidase T n=1 Tax=Blastococcus saxobsidens (strain DD2) TaxID=1146883 RepID=H6RUY7_BLASD|nr:M14 family zinc carboxypeptidase [Blastococcus saxobsidens]CCG04509.1 Carboxypeptidase T [Blastococcus saxobsidens DD2]
MNPRSPRRRAALCAVGTAVLVAVTTATAPAAPAAATGGELTAEEFRPQLVTVDTPTREDKRLLQTLGLDLTEHAGHDYVEVVLHSPADVTALLAAGLSYAVRIPDLLVREAENSRVNAAYAAATTTSPLPSGRDAYRTLADYDADMAALERDHPDLVELITLPHRSLDGREIHGVEIGADVRGPDRGLPTFVMLGVHHAREWPSGEHAMEFAVDLVENYGNDPRITDLVNRSRVVVVPVVNVDGFELSRTDGGLVDLREVDQGGTGTILGTPGNAYKRKNCRLVDGQDTPDGTCRAGSLTSPGGYGTGVDLNRNYGGYWGGPGASDLFADPTYRGAAAFSEPETQNIRELVSGRHVTTLITNHTFSNLVLRPGGVAPDQVPPSEGIPLGDPYDEAALKALGDAMAAQNGYTSQHAWELYDTTGSTEDWSYNATGGFGYTFEIGPDEFHPPFPQVIDEYLGAGEHAGRGNREAYLLALENAVNPATHSVLTGKAPAGATLRLRKTVATPTWTGSIEDTLDTAMTVGPDGRFTWHVNPSTRPVVKDRQVETVSSEPVAQETFTGTTLPLQSTDSEFTVDRDADLFEIVLDWPTPDDMDLEVYRKNADGSLEQVGGSGNFVGEKERVLLQDPAQGTYVLRAINFASVAPTWTLTASLFDAESSSVPGLVENWTLTCEVAGQVRQTVPVVVDRGQQLRVDLKACGRR